MSIDNIDRRSLAFAVGAALAATGLASVGASPVQAYQGNMERALSSLFQALSSLREATPNKGGHRETAIQLVQQAISETQAGIEWADQHGGDGAQ